MSISLTKQQVPQVARILRRLTDPDSPVHLSVPKPDYVTVRFRECGEPDRVRQIEIGPRGGWNEEIIR